MKRITVTFTDQCAADELWGVLACSAVEAHQPSFSFTSSDTSNVWDRFTVAGFYSEHDLIDVHDSLRRNIGTIVSMTSEVQA